MTREELEKEATSTIEWESTPMIDRPLFVHAYITGAEPREKRIEELEDERVDFIGKVAFLENDLNNAKARIEKMKECANCPTWLLNQTEKNCRDCKYKEALILLRK